MTADAEMHLFLAAIDRPLHERAAFVAAVEPPELRQRLAALLAAHDDLGDADTMLPAPLSRPSVQPVPGTVVDGFRIVRMVGRGGMGVVWEAEQLQPRRRVALKTLPPEFADAQHERRLEQEARLLARLLHPGIAQVYGSGRSQAFGGAPWLVLEFVDGLPLDRHAEQRRLDTTARLRLLADIAEAVAHAHARGVIHRDLKPGNILVDRQSRAKVLDFGIARLAQRTAADDSLAWRTLPGQVLGTLPYMAPEVFTGGDDAIDVRVDVWALGVIGFELLTGRLPIDVANLPLAAAAHAIADGTPPRLGQVQRALRGDIELVIGKALAKDPAWRYPSAAELAADLRRLLAGEPVLAHPPSRTYRLRKLVLRHRAVSAALLFAFAALAFGLWQTEAARAEAVAAGKHAEQAADREAQRAHAAERLGEILAGLVDRATPQHHGGEPEPITAVVDDLAGSVDRLAPDEPWVQARVHLFLGEAMYRSGRTEEARRHLQAADTAFGRSPLTAPRDRAQLTIAEARLAAVAGKHDVAERLLRGVRADCQDAADRRTEHLTAGQELVNVLTARATGLAEAEVLAREWLAATAAAHGEHSRRYAAALHALALVHRARGRLDDAIDLHEQVVDIRSQLQPDTLALATALQNLAHALQLADRHDEALVHCRAALTIQRRVHREHLHKDLGFSLDIEGSLLRYLGRHDEALNCFAEAERHFTGHCGPDHPDVAVCLTEWGLTLDQAGRGAEAVPLLQRALAIRRQHDPDGSAAHAATLEALALASIGVAPSAEAVALAERALAMRETVHGSGHPLRVRALEALGATLLHAERWAECEAVGRELLALRRRELGDAHWLTWAHGSLVWIPLSRRGLHAQALELATAAVDGLERCEQPGTWLRHALAAQRDLAQLAGRPEIEATAAARLAALTGR